MTANCREAKPPLSVLSAPLQVPTLLLLIMISSVLFKFIMPKGTPASIDISDLILNGLNCVLRYP